jgi:hypothetical protein
MSDVSLDERAKLLDSKRLNVEGEPGTGIRLDLLCALCAQLNADKDLIKIFGDPVSSRLAVFSNGKDISIVDAGVVKLSEGQKLDFLMRLKNIYEKTLKGAV